ncbi:MAG: hypothetical protein ACFFCI_13515 [Promethearchaeota archaeon]
MKVNKISIRPNKVGIDLVLCPKTNLYLQDLYCRRCSYFKLDTEKFVQCEFVGHRYNQSDPIKDKLFKDLSKSFITELPQDDMNKTPIEIEESISKEQNSEITATNHFTQTLEKAKNQKIKKELEKTHLSKYIQKTNLSTRLENIKKTPTKE